MNAVGQQLRLPVLRGRRGEGGFTLLEIMVSLAILAASLVVLIRIVTNNVQATNRVKLLTAATFLARAKLTEIEDRVLTLGFVDIDEEDAGDFTSEGQPNMTWSSMTERVQLPTDMGQQAQQASSNASQSATNVGQQSPLQFMAGMMGGMMSMLVDPIRLGLQESVRRVTVKVFWDEIGKGRQQIEVATFLTDPARLENAMQMASAPAGAAPGSGSPGSNAAPGAAASGTSGAPAMAPPPGITR